MEEEEEVRVFVFVMNGCMGVSFYNLFLLVVHENEECERIN